MTAMAIPRDPRDLSHLVGKRIPSVKLETSDGATIDLAKLPGRTVVFMQPGSSAAISPIDGWVDRIKMIPGAAGCTGQCKMFSSLAADFAAVGVRVFGLSGQTPAELASVKSKLGLTLTLLSDTAQQFLEGLCLTPIRHESPDGKGLKPYHPRAILVIESGVISSATIPEPSPEGASKSAQETLERLQKQSVNPGTTYLALTAPQRLN